MNLILVHDWQGQSIRQREDGYVCLTDMAKASGKRVGDYFGLDCTKEYIDALAQDLCLLPATLVTKVRGTTEGQARGGGATYAHIEIAIDFAQWVSIPFRIWANRVLRDVIVNGGYIRTDATAEQVRALTAKYKYLSEESRREAYPLFRKIAKLNHPTPQGKQTVEQKETIALARSETYIACWKAWENSSHHFKTYLTLDEVDSFLPSHLVTPWKEQNA
jgi:hypothetical protein